MRSDREVWNDAKRQEPFSKPAERYAWMDQWCSRCEHEWDCTLIVTEFNGRTPAEWIHQQGGSPAERYVCTEFAEAGS